MTSLWVEPPGQDLLELIRSAQHRIVLVAPYMKITAVQRILSEIPESVTECIWVTRWLPSDIASGASDLEIYHPITQHSRGKLLLHTRLHAKYYSNGQHSLIGSANVTLRGLSWCPTGNVELLVDLPANHDGLLEWEARLLQESVTASNSLYDSIQRQVKLLGDHGPYSASPEVESTEEGSGDEWSWIPTCPVPEHLWTVYCGIEADSVMTKSALQLARQDLNVLDPPFGLDEQMFETYVCGTLDRMPIFKEVDLRAGTGLADTTAENMLMKYCSSPIHRQDRHRAWQTMKSWIRYFMPNRYRAEVSHEVLVKGKKIR